MMVVRDLSGLVQALECSPATPLGTTLKSTTGTMRRTVGRSTQAVTGNLSKTLPNVMSNMQVRCMPR